MTDGEDEVTVAFADVSYRQIAMSLLMIMLFLSAFFTVAAVDAQKKMDSMEEKLRECYGLDGEPVNPENGFFYEEDALDGGDTP